MSEISENIKQNLAELRNIISRRLSEYFKNDNNPELREGINISFFQAEQRLSYEEKLILLIALAPHVQPGFFESIIQQYLPQGGDFPEIGGVKGTHYRGMLPTGETVIFILAGDDPEKRLQLQHFFSEDHFFYKERILQLEAVSAGEPQLSGRLILSHEYVDYFTSGQLSKPHFGPEFPAKRLTTAMDWDDLVLPPRVMSDIDFIRIWLQHNRGLLEDYQFSKRIKPGFKALFNGPSGTGKTLTATLLGKEFHKDVYRIDLSQVVSKYIGETEKNLEKVFGRAENKGWILFFDEADALFGKRSNVQNAHDRYANQEIAYLLQRLEDYDGLVILASNYKNNIDLAFARRFNAVIYFPLPPVEQRLLLWEKALPQRFELAFNYQLLAQKYELTGAGIVNVIHYAALQAISRCDNALRLNDIMDGMRKEFSKEEKMFI